jgi:hypothetical protein
MTAPIKPLAPRSPKAPGRDQQNNNDACAKRRLQKKEPSARGAEVNASIHAGTGGCRSPTNVPVVNSPTNVPVVNILLQKPPPEATHGAAANAGIRTGTCGYLKGSMCLTPDGSAL